MSLFRLSRQLPTRTISTVLSRPFSSTAHAAREGDTGSHRFSGERDAWSKREQAAEGLYMLGREKQIMELLKERIRQQEAVLSKDRAILTHMEDQYGHHVEGVDSQYDGFQGKQMTS